MTAAATLLLATRRTTYAQKPLVLGRADHQYEWNSDWVKLPSGVQLGSCHGGIVLDSHRRVYLNTETENAVMVFDPDGRFIKAWGKDYQGGAHGMMIRREGKDEFLYLTHTARHELIKTTLDGEQVWTRGYPMADIYKDASEYKPTAVAFAPNGDIYVTDGYGKFWVHQYNSRGDYLRSWGGAGSEQGKLNNPHGIWVDTRRSDPPTVVVADRGNRRLQIFDLNGVHQSFVTDEMRLPSNIAQYKTDLAVADLAGRVTILDKDNKVITYLGDNTDPNMRATNQIPPERWTNGVFISPHCVRWDADGNLYVHEWLTHGRVIKLKRIRN